MNLEDRTKNYLDPSNSNNNNEQNDEVTNFLINLCNIKPPNPSECLYPVGNIYWFVPDICIKDDIVTRRRKLIKLDLRHFKTDNTNDTNSDTNEKNWEELIIKDKIENNNSKHQWVLCDVTKERKLFQEYVFEFYDSLYTHLPNRYLEIFNCTLYQ